VARGFVDEYSDGNPHIYTDQYADPDMDIDANCDCNAK
jgi:hypothetical protein